MTEERQNEIVNMVTEEYNSRFENSRIWDSNRLQNITNLRLAVGYIESEINVYNRLHELLISCSDVDTVERIALGVKIEEHITFLVLKKSELDNMWDRIISRDYPIRNAEVFLECHCKEIWENLPKLNLYGLIEIQNDRYNFLGEPKLFASLLTLTWKKDSLDSRIVDYFLCNGKEINFSTLKTYVSRKPLPKDWDRLKLVFPDIEAWNLQWSTMS